MAKNRFIRLDALRGAALLAMALFHLLFDLSYFKAWPVDVHSGFWFYFARLTAASFLFIAGASLYISDSRFGEKERAWYHFRRGAVVFAAGMLVSAVTLFLFPSQGVWWGILHAIGACIMLLWPLSRLGKWNCVLAVGVLLASAVAGGIAVGYPWLLWLGIAPAGFQSFDYVPLLPWAAPFLLGLWAGKPLKALLEKGAGRKAGLACGWMAWLGRNSLLFYLAHQPVLVALVLLFG